MITLALGRNPFWYLLVACFLSSDWVAGSETWQVGFGRVDITPTESVRLSGYGSRSTPSNTHETPLFVRAMAFRNEVSTENADVHLLISIDTIGVPAALSKEITDAIKDAYGIERKGVVLACSHTHCAPDLLGDLSNIYAVSLTEDERAAASRYRDFLKASVLRSTAEALQTMQPGRLRCGKGQVGFAANRRVINTGKWTGFGVRSEGLFDHSVPVISIEDLDGKVRGIVFNYACHCTSINPEINEVNYDWAGYAAAELESTFDGCVALATIGCGADQNPSPRGTTDIAKMHGLALAAEVQRVLSSELKPINDELQANFDFAALSFDLPTIEEVRSQLTDPMPQARRRAEHLDAVYKRDGRLPATYPVPIQSWKFGDDLTMVFIGGEVVVGYAHRLRNELKDEDLWVTAYANDVMGYVCTEAIRNEGGYEFDSSAIYYNLPGPWASGTEDFLIQRVLTLIQAGGRAQPVEPEDILSSFELDNEYDIQLVACEPLVVDPINIAFGADGKLWVVEMGDYPEGLEETNRGGGRIKILTDTDHDGRYDTATVFLDGLEFPTGVFPVYDGVLVTAAPEIFLAKDIDGDGKCDMRETWYSGFSLSNPQHRINGFTYSLDHTLHCASGDNLGEILCHRTGATINASGHDVRINLRTGEMDLVNGRSQYIRSRNTWGDWFGSDNSRPMYHYPIDGRYFARANSAEPDSNAQQLFDPPVAPRVYPASNTVERFNDLFATNRFTSACSAIVAGWPFNHGDDEVLFVCEPVHNLVHRSILKVNGSTYQAVRHADNQNSEFLSSRDPWFRPVRAMAGPDGSLWVVDMYRESIEHPEWIPDAWKQQLNLRAGDDRGRIYRVLPKGAHSSNAVAIDHLDLEMLVHLLKDERRGLRDLVHQRIIETVDAPSEDTIGNVRQLLNGAHGAEAQVHALHLLDYWGILTERDLEEVIDFGHVGSQMVAVELSEKLLAQNPSLVELIGNCGRLSDVRLAKRVALAMGGVESDQAGKYLSNISRRGDVDEWLASALSAALAFHPSEIAGALLDKLVASRRSFTEADERLLVNSLRAMNQNGLDVGRFLKPILQQAAGDGEQELYLASIVVGAMEKDKLSVDDEQFEAWYKNAIAILKDDRKAEDVRCRALQLIGVGLASESAEIELLLDLLSSVVPIQLQQKSLERLAVLRPSDLPSRLFEKWGNMSASLRSACVNCLLNRSVWQDDLVSALERGAIKVNDLSQADRQRLRISGSRSLQVRVDRVLGQAGSKEKRGLVDSYLAAVSASGNQTQGRQLFTQHCAACHIAKEGAEPVGASLSNLSNNKPRFLIESILDPNRTVDPKYQNYTVLTLDGRALSGVIIEESTGRIVLGHADGGRTAIARSEISELKNTGISLMPEGFEQQITPEQMSDLVNFISNGGLIEISGARNLIRP